jgi:hypothetical protein
MKRALIVATSVLSACTSRAGPPTFRIETAGTTCSSPSGAAPVACSVSAALASSFDGLAVVAVTDGDQEIERAVVPLSSGRGSFRRAGLGPPARSTGYGVSLVGYVAEPVNDHLGVTGEVTTCRGEPLGDAQSEACRTTGIVQSSRPDPWLAVVEVQTPPLPGQSTPGMRVWGLVRLREGSGTFSVDWTRRRAAAGAGADVRAVGIVVRGGDQPGKASERARNQPKN